MKSYFMEQRAKKSLEGFCCLYNVHLKLHARNTGRWKKFGLSGLSISNSGIILLFRFLFIAYLYIYPFTSQSCHLRKCCKKKVLPQHHLKIKSCNLWRQTFFLKNTLSKQNFQLPFNTNIKHFNSNIYLFFIYCTF